MKCQNCSKDVNVLFCSFYSKNDEKDICKKCKQEEILERNKKKKNSGYHDLANFIIHGKK
jgi:hypothetical protein